MLYRDFATLIDVTDAGSAALTGKSIVINPLSWDRVADHDQGVVVVANGAWSGGSMDASVQVIVETSADGETWFPVWTGFPGQNPFKLIGTPKLDDMGGGNEPAAVLLWVRVRTEPQGTEFADVDRLKVLLGSTAPLRGRIAA